jgi:uncharacterized membrane protein YidH (DUF202 family)
LKVHVHGSDLVKLREPTTANGILEEVRTLLALERNYLSEERTELSIFRTGLTLVLVGPSANAILAYTTTAFQVAPPLSLTLLIYIFFFAITVIGCWLCINSYRKLNKVRKKIKKLKVHKVKMIKESKVAFDLLGKFIDQDND